MWKTKLKVKAKRSQAKEVIITKDIKGQKEKQKSKWSISGMFSSAKKGVKNLFGYGEEDNERRTETMQEDRKVGTIDIDGNYTPRYYLFTVDQQSYSETLPPCSNFAAKCFQNVYKSIGEIEDDRQEKENMINKQQEIINWIKSELIDVHVKKFLANEIFADDLVDQHFNGEFKGMDDYKFIDVKTREDVVKRIMPLVIKRLIEYVNQQLEFGQNEFSFNFIGFITSFITKKLDSYEIIKILQRGLEDKCIDSNMYKVLVFGTMLSPVYIQAGMIDQNALMDTLRKIQQISEENSRKEAFKNKAEKFTKILDNDTETKEFPLMEHIKKLESEGDEASLKEIINYLVKVQFSYKQVRDFFKQLRLKIPDALIGSHFILTSMDVIKKTKWAIDNSKECYVVLGNMGAGKSTFIHYLQNNVEAHKVKCSETWSLKQKIFKNPYIHTQFINSETIIPWNYEIELNKENVYIYDTPGFNITDSYEQEIVSSLALKDALEKIRILKVIPVISFDDFTPPATNFVKFLEGLSKVLKGSKPSIYIINKACLSEKPKIKTILARLAKEIPEHRETINDIKEKFEIFPKQKDHKPQNLK